MKSYVVKKLYKGYASLRDYLVEEAIKRNEGIVIIYNSKEYRFNNTQVVSMFQLHRKIFKSKFNDKEYQLIDFPIKVQSRKQQSELTEWI